VGFNDKIHHGFGFKRLAFPPVPAEFLMNVGVPRYAPPIKLFQKKKKEKKESHYLKWRVSKKQVFLIKYYLIHHRRWGLEIR
jgi:hypothetical protein